MYDIQEIKTARNYWSIWLSGFTVGESKVIDPQDKGRIGVSITNCFHNKQLARFKIKTINGETTVTRTL